MGNKRENKKGYVMEIKSPHNIPRKILRFKIGFMEHMLAKI